jgi:predicted DNA-binding transcriptional regulator YafY
LVTLLNVKLEQAHRALADSQACLEVAIQCMEKLGPSESLEFMFKAQEGPFHWTRFSMSELLKVEHLSVVVKASMSQLVIEIEYQGGTQPGKPRRITPQGVVRNMTGDYVVGLCHIENIEKRFYLNRILSAKILD